MFDFMLMFEPYENRKVARFENGDLIISTARVTDTEHPFETGIAHPQYNRNHIIIVEEYDSLEDAKEGHERWVAFMTKGDLPDELIDVSSSHIKRVSEMLGRNPLDDVMEKEDA